MSYSFDSIIRFSETGEDELLTISALVNYLQDCSNFHSSICGRGYEELQKKDRLWLFSSWQIEVKRRPGIGEKVRISTWPYEFKGFFGLRNYVFETAAGERLAYANAIFVYLDAKNGLPTKLDEEEIAGYELSEPLTMEYAPRKVLMPKERAVKESFQVQHHHIDVYHHVNNGEYITMAENYLPEGFVVAQMRAEYKNQAKLGNIIVPEVATTEKGIIVALCDEEHTPYAVVEFSSAMD